MSSSAGAAACPDDGAHVRDGFFQNIVDDKIIIPGGFSNFRFGGIEPAPDDFLRFSPAAAQPLFESIQGRGEDENRRRCKAARLHLSSPLHIDFQKDIQAVGKGGFHVTAVRAVVMAVNFSPFEKPSRADPFFENVPGQEMIVYPVGFARARRPRGAGDGKRSRESLASRARTMVLLPTPDGAESTKRCPDPSPAMSLPALGRRPVPVGLIVDEPLGDGFRLDTGQDHMVAVRNDDGAGAPPHGGVDELVVLFGVFLKTLHGRRTGRDDGHDAVGHHRVAEPDVEKF